MPKQNRPRGKIKLTHLDSGDSFREWLRNKIGDQNREGLAKKIGVNRVQFNNYSPVNAESNSNIPTYENFLKVIGYFGENPHTFHRQGTNMVGEIELRKDEILRCYKELGMSAEEIAAYFETSPKTIGVYLEGWGEKLSREELNDRRVFFETGELPKEELERLVLNDKLSKPQVVERTGIPNATLERLLDKHGIYFPDANKTARKSYLDICQHYGEYNLVQLAKLYGVATDTIKDILLKNGVEIRDSKYKDENWEAKRLARIAAAKNGIPLSNDHKKRIAEARIKAGNGKVEYQGIIYGSKQEAAAAQILDKYVPGFELKLGENFQRVSDEGKIFDFVFPGRVVEWHPANLDYDAKTLLREDDYRAFRELEAECPQEKSVLYKMVVDDVERLYEKDRINAISRDSRLNGYGLSILKSFDELYSFVSEYNPNIPHKSVVRNLYEKVKKNAKYVVKENNSSNTSESDEVAA